MSIYKGNNLLAGLPDISGKANVSLDNLSSAGDIYGSKLCMPSSTFMNLTLGSSGTRYTAPANGYFTIRADGSAADTTARFVNETAGGICGGWTTGSGGQAAVHAFIPALKGQSVLLEYASLTTVYWF